MICNREIRLTSHPFSVQDGTCSSKSAKLRCHRHPPTLHRPNCLCLCNANFILHNSKVKNWSRGFACLSNRRVACAPRRWNGESGGGHASPKQSRVASRSVRGDTQRGREREREPWPRRPRNQIRCLTAACRALVDLQTNGDLLSSPSVVYGAAQQSNSGPLLFFVSYFFHLGTQRNGGKSSGKGCLFWRSGLRPGRRRTPLRPTPGLGLRQNRQPFPLLFPPLRCVPRWKK
jgi:hypothetical protein